MLQECRAVFQRVDAIRPQARDAATGQVCCGYGQGLLWPRARSRPRARPAAGLGSAQDSACGGLFATSATDKSAGLSLRVLSMTRLAFLSDSRATSTTPYALLFRAGTRNSTAVRLVLAVGPRICRAVAGSCLRRRRRNLSVDDQGRSHCSWESRKPWSACLCRGPAMIGFPWGTFAPGLPACSKPHWLLSSATRASTV